MADWSKNKADPSAINSGKEYEQKDRVSREQLNAITNNAFYAVEKSEEALEKANSAFEGNGTIVRVDGVPQAYIDFDSDPQAQLDKAERTEVIYDMDSGSPLDWGKTGGIANGGSVSGKDFSKYKRLRCYLRCGSQFPVVEVDLTAPSRILSGGNYNGTDNSYYVESLGQLLVSITVSGDKTSISVSAKYSSQSANDFLIYRIEGVL